MTFTLGENETTSETDIRYFHVYKRKVTKMAVIIIIEVLLLCSLQLCEDKPSITLSVMKADKLQSSAHLESKSGFMFE